MSFLKEIVINIVVFFLLSRTIITEAKFLKHEYSKDVEAISKCIQAIANIESYTRLTVIISDGKYFNDSLDIEDDYACALTRILSQVYIPQIVVKDWHYLDEKDENLLIVLIINNCYSLAHLNATVIKDFKYLIVIKGSLKLNCKPELAETGYKLQHRDATFFLRNTNNSEYNLVTVIPKINGDICQYDNKVTLTLVNTCTNGKLRDREVFPLKKPKNFKKCEFKVGMATMYPYAIAKNRDTLQNLQQLNEDQIHGSDLEIMKIISNYFNASLKLYYIYREEENPFLNQEFLPFVINGSLDACAGGLYRIYENFVYYSGIYTRQTVHWVYVAEREQKSWQTAISKINGFYIFILFYIGYSFIWILFCNFNDVVVSSKNIFLYSLGTLLGTSTLKDPIDSKQKILNISYLLLCMHLSAYLNVQLYSFFTIQGPPQTLKTNDDVMESGITPYLINDSKYVIEDAKYVAFANTSNDCANFQDCEQKMLSNKGITILLEAYFHRLQAFTAVNNEARVLRAKENIYVVFHEMIIRKDSPFTGKFQWIVQRLFEAGICNQLYLNSIGLLVEEKGKEANANIMANSYRCKSGCPINITQFAGAILLWLIGSVLALLVFFIEVVTSKKSRV